ncbi:hypothetical protein KM043_011593 [Ampulex compressa]|nr:hypothetical protein KM043_011593 [Ampulex compressa]
MDVNEGNSDVREKITKAEKILNCSTVDKNVTEEEFQNFLYRVTEVEKIVKKLASSDLKEQKDGEILADQILKGKILKDHLVYDEVTVKTNRTVINKCSSNLDNSDPNKMSQEIFMRTLEKDAKRRAEDRKKRNEEAETWKQIANGAFKEQNYEKAVTYYSKAIELRKDSSVLWNNRALSYINLGLFEFALHDCEWALKVNNSNLKALLNSAKCYKHLGNEDKFEEFIQLANERNRHFSKFINDFKETLKTEFNAPEFQELHEEEK